MLSLIELQRKKVEAKRKKYDKDEMDSYLELVYENYKELIEENKKLEAEKNELNQKNKKLSDGVQYYHSIETTLQKALILAEKTSKETKDAAILKAEAIEKEANHKADEIIRTAEGEYNKIKGKCVQLVQQFNEYKLQLIEAASTQLQLVEGDEFDISNPDEFEKTLDIPVVKESKKSAPPKTTKPVSKSAPHPAQPAPTVQQTTVKPKAAPAPQTAPAKTSSPATAATREDILNADTIDLRVTLDAVRTEAEQAPAASVKPQKQPAVQKPVAEKLEPQKPVAEKLEPQETVTEQLEPQKIETEKLEPQEMKLESIDTLDVISEQENNNSKLEDTPKVAEVKAATIVEPVQAKTVAPMDIIFEDEIAANEERAKETAEPSPAEKAAEAVPTLDSLLQDLNINNKGNQKSDDPFEFLGSVDDF